MWAYGTLSPCGLEHGQALGGLGRLLREGAGDDTGGGQATRRIAQRRQQIGNALRVDMRAYGALRSA